MQWYCALVNIFHTSKQDKKLQHKVYLQPLTFVRLLIPSVWDTYSGAHPLNETGEDKGVPISFAFNGNVNVSVNVTDGLGGIDQWRRQHHRLSAPRFEHVHEATDLTSKLETKSHSFNNMSKSLLLRRVKLSHWSRWSWTAILCDAMTSVTLVALHCWYLYQLQYPTAPPLHRRLSFAHPRDIFMYM